jgi:hypothetical protein
MTETENPTTYEAWVHCITVKCKIALTPEFARQRIGALGDAKSAEAIKFAQLYGEPHRARVVEWYRRAAG